MEIAFLPSFFNVMVNTFLDTVEKSRELLVSGSGFHYVETGRTPHSRTKSSNYVPCILLESLEKKRLTEDLLKDHFANIRGCF